MNRSMQGSYLTMIILVSAAMFASPSLVHAQIFGGRLFGGGFNNAGFSNAGFNGGYSRYPASYNSFPTDPPLAPSWTNGPVRRAPTYNEYYRYMNSHFPKYYGGFHANYFQSTGISPGDYGLRGNGFQATPW